MRVALIPGSFDPITLGHVNIIERAAKVFDRVCVAVMNNDSSKYAANLSSKTYMFDMEKRLEMARLSTAHIQNVAVIGRSGMLLVDLFDELEADAIVKGVRNAADLEYELIHAKWNREHNERAETLFLPADERFDNLSSTLIRQLISKGDFDALEGLMSPEAIKLIKNTRNILTE
jgi:pantetheine-phosphate adenylyltransferase